MKQVNVITAEIFSEAGGNAEYHFLFSPAPADLIRALRDEIDRLSEAAPDEAEHLHDLRQKCLAQLSRLCDVAAVCESLPADVPEPLAHTITVADVQIGSIHLRSFAAWAQCASST